MLRDENTVLRSSAVLRSGAELELELEEVGHDHVRTKSGRVAPIQKPKSRSKALTTVLNEKVC